MELNQIKAYLATISTPVRLVTIVNGKRDSFNFDGKEFPEGLESVYPCDYVLDNPYHKEKFDEYIASLSPVVANDDEVKEAPRRGRPPKKVMEGEI